MNDNKKRKLLAHLQNTLTQIQTAKAKLGYSIEEQQTSKLLSESARKVEESIKVAEKIVTCEDVPKPKKKPVKLPERNDLDKYDEYHRSNVIIVGASKPRIFSKPCRYLIIEKDMNGNIINRKCSVHYDISKCDDYCPYHTENQSGVRSKPYGEKF